MNKYFLFELNNSNYNYLVISLTYESVLIFIKSLEKKIKKQEAILLFDLALVNANKSNRYVLAIFKNKKIDLKSFEIVNSKNVSKEIKEISKQYFVKNKKILKNNVLNEKDINKLLKQ